VRSIRRIAVLAVFLAGVSAVPIAGAGPRATVIPAGHLAGDTGGSLLGGWYQYGLSLPADTSPFAGASNACLSLGHNGKVLSPMGGVNVPGVGTRMACTVRVGQPVLLVMTSADCSSREEDPFHGDTEAEQRACVIKATTADPDIVDVRAIRVSVDGAPEVDIHSPAYYAVSPQERVVFPANPVFGVKVPGPATFVASGWIAEIEGMGRGSHVVRAQVSVADGVFDPFVIDFTVVNGSGT